MSLKQTVNRKCELSETLKEIVLWRGTEKWAVAGRGCRIKDYHGLFSADRKGDDWSSQLLEGGDSITVLGIRVGQSTHQREEKRIKSTDVVGVKTLWWEQRDGFFLLLLFSTKIRSKVISWVRRKSVKYSSKRVNWLGQCGRVARGSTWGLYSWLKVRLIHDHVFLPSHIRLLGMGKEGQKVRFNQWWSFAKWVPWKERERQVKRVSGRVDHWI